MGLWMHYAQLNKANIGSGGIMDQDALKFFPRYFSTIAAAIGCSATVP